MNFCCVKLYAFEESFDCYLSIMHMHMLRFKIIMMHLGNYVYTIRSTKGGQLCTHCNMISLRFLSALKKHLTAGNLI